ncbi:MAG: tryptophan synthase subunit alpha [Chitinivibrionales bacterium]|nr:tryptophan synthase subunit alpha [Chitinivibrionales bacterium]MBD3396394.1 tryptophan synthase subunit alpha [Chitinivibrionales bacterium]
MSRYDNAFSAVRKQNRIAFVPFAVAGDPDLRTSEKILRAYLSAGADILEIGYPFSDPMADGPVNQRAAQRAIASGITPARFFAMIRRLRAATDAPFGLLLYANTMHHLGCEAFCAAAADAGIDSLLVADMPPEESRDLLKAMRKHGLASVFIVSELTPPERIRFICRQTSAFVYVVSRLGTTGVHRDFSTSVRQTIRRLRGLTSLPLCVGFGLSSPRHVAEVRDAGADGAIVGSRLVSIVEKEHAHTGAMLAAIGRAVRRFRKATICPSGRRR